MRQKFQVTVIAKDYWIVEIEAEDEVEAEDLATDMCQAELLSVSEKEKVKPHSHLKFLDSEWDFYVDRKENV